MFLLVFAKNYCFLCASGMLTNVRQTKNKQTKENSNRQISPFFFLWKKETKNNNIQKHRMQQKEATLNRETRKTEKTEKIKKTKNCSKKAGKKNQKKKHLLFRYPDQQT